MTRWYEDKVPTSVVADLTKLATAVGGTASIGDEPQTE